MKLDRLALSAAVVLALGTAAQAAEIGQPVPAETPKALELTTEQLDRITAGGPIGDLARALFAQAALSELQSGFAGGPSGAVGSGITVLSQYVILEILIAQNGL